jgi:Glyoxalase-like domain
MCMKLARYSLPLMAATFQIAIDCADPDRLVRFWTLALDYVVEPAPAGKATWREYWLSIGVPADELGDGDCADSIIDPAGIGPRIWFQPVPETKAIKNRLHLDIRASGGREEPISERRTKVDAKVAQLARTHF